MKIYTQNQIHEAGDALKNHEILAFPTDTVYGVGCLFGNLDDLSKLKAAKKRPESKPVPIMASSIEMLEEVAELDEREKRIAEKFLPGPLTLIAPLKKGIDRAFTNGNETVALRIPNDSFVLEMISYIGSPLFVTSANISGNPTALTYEDALHDLSDIDGIVKGVCQNLEASTILDCSKEKLTVLREGPLSLEEIEKELDCQKS